MVVKATVQIHFTAELKSHLAACFTFIVVHLVASGFWLYCRTALAEAELEYNENHKSTAVYVKFPLRSAPDALKSELGTLLCIDETQAGGYSMRETRQECWLFARFCGELRPDNPTYPKDCTVFSTQLNNLYNEIKIKIRGCHLMLNSSCLDTPPILLPVFHLFAQY